MGQRLNIEIYSDGECQANCYYHWSAYTGSAIHETLGIIANYMANVKGKYKTIKEKAVMCFAECSTTSFATGGVTTAGLKEESYEYVKKHYPELPIGEAVDRNAGLIGCTESDMNDTRNWEEGRVTIDLDSETVIFDVIYTYNVSDYISERQEWDEEFDIEEILKFPVFRGNICELTFNQFELFARFVAQTRGDFMANGEEGMYVIATIE